MLKTDKYTPEQDAVRAAMLGVTAPTDGQITHFSDVTLDTLETLNSLGFLDLEDAQNDSPTIGQLMATMRTMPHARAHGYIVANSRSDRRISLEGLSLLMDAPRSEVETFAEWVEDTRPDECDSHYAWWD